MTSKEQILVRKAKKRKKVVTTSQEFEESDKRSRHPIWEFLELMALIKAEREVHATSKLLVDQQARMEIADNKWQKVSQSVMASGNVVHMRSGAACKNKWAPIYGELKRIHDHMNATRNNEEYWNMSPIERHTLRLPKNFNKFMYSAIDEFQSDRPTLHLVNAKDFLNEEDDYYPNMTRIELDNPMEMDNETNKENPI